MARPRTNDPLGTSDNPVTVSDPVRIAEIVEEAKRRMDYLARNYTWARQVFGGKKEFNGNLEQLKDIVDGKTASFSRQERLHVELEMMVTHHARKHALARTGHAASAVVEEDVEAALETISSSVRTRRGRPDDFILRHHVEAYMALVQEMTGIPVRATLVRKDKYEPHFPDEVSALVPHFFQWLDPEVSSTTLAIMVCDARRKYAGKPMRFRDFFPFYGGRIDPETGMPLPGPGYRLEGFEPNVPIYFSNKS